MNNVVYGVLGLIFSQLGQAQPELAIGIDSRWFDWREYYNGQQLLKESGPQALLALRIKSTQQPWLWQAEARVGGGIAQYDGALQDNTPYQAPAYEQVIEVDIRGGYQWPQANVYVGAQRRDWWRYINGSDSVASAQEKYSWYMATVGSEISIPPIFKQAAKVHVQIEKSLQTKQSANSPRGTIHLEPGASYVYQLGLLLNNKENALTIEPYYQYQLIPKSDSVDGYFQPKSLRQELGVKFLWNVNLR